MNLIAVGVHERHFTALKVRLGQHVSSLASEIRFLLRDNIPSTELVERRAAAGRRRLYVDGFDNVRGFVVENNGTRFGVFSEHNSISKDEVSHDAMHRRKD